MTLLELRPTRRRLLLLLLGCIAFVAAGVWFILAAETIAASSPHFSASLIRPLGVVSILFFGYAGIVAIRQMLDARPRLILDDNGIFDRTLATPVIPWGSILAAEIVAVKGNKFIALRIADEAERVAALPAIKRAMTAGNEGMGFARFNLNLSALDISAEQLLAIIHQQLAERRAILSGDR